MRKRNIRHNIRLSVEEKDSMMDHYLASKSTISFTEYFRRISLGEIPHPNFASATKATETEIPKNADVPNVGKVTGSKETRHHIQAMILAADMLRIKEDPFYQKIIKQNSKEFKRLVDAVRGYKFDEKTLTKSPLKGETQRKG